MQLMNVPGKISLLISTSPSPPQPQCIIILLSPWLWHSLALVDLWRHQDFNLWDILKTYISVTNFWGEDSDPLKWGKTNFTAPGTAVFSQGCIGSTSQMRKLTHIQVPWGLHPRAGAAYFTQPVDEKKQTEGTTSGPEGTKQKAEG